MLKKHNAKHHCKEDQVFEKEAKGQKTACKNVTKKQVGMDIKCVKCIETFMTKQDLKIHMINVHQKDTKLKKCKYQMIGKVSSWECNQCTKKFKVHSKLLSHIHQKRTC